MVNVERQSEDDGSVTRRQYVEKVGKEGVIADPRTSEFHQKKLLEWLAKLLGGVDVEQM